MKADGGGLTGRAAEGEKEEREAGDGGKELTCSELAEG